MSAKLQAVAETVLQKSKIHTCILHAYSIRKNVEHVQRQYSSNIIQDRPHSTRILPNLYAGRGRQRKCEEGEHEELEWGKLVCVAAVDCRAQSPGRSWSGARRVLGR